jgi:MFS transporter, DHA2 family, multidrug resistance protein
VATAAAPAVTARPERADATAWIAVAAGALGALLATLDISIVNSALPTIQGEIGATGTEATWIATSFLVAEIVIIPLSAWLERLLGLRTLLLIAVTAFTGFSILCGLATDLLTMIIGRTGQGLVGGALIPTAMTIVGKRLPPNQQPIGMALFGMTVILGPVLGPLLGGWLTENLSWHYAFFINVPVCGVLLLLLLLGLPHERTNWVFLREADWLGIIGMILGLGAMTVVLEEGQREEWFESQLIVQLTVVATVGFALLLIGQITARRPVLKLRLVLSRHFSGVVIMALALGMVMFGSMFVIPQFLAVIADYNALQTGYVIFLMGVPALALMPALPFLMRIVDIRIALATALALMALSCFLTDSLTIESGGGDFTASQLVRGVGAVLLMLYLNQSAISSVSKEDAGDASAIFNAARNLGGSFALAAVGTLMERRMWLHSRRIEETLPANQWHVQDYLGGIAHSAGNPEATFAMLSAAIQQQALAMTYNDIFWGMGVVTLITVPLAFFLRPLPKGLSLAMH